MAGGELVEDPEQQDEAQALKTREREARRPWTACAVPEAAEQAKRDAEAQLEDVVERQHDGERAIGFGTQPKTLIAVRIGENDEAAVRPDAVGARGAERSRVERDRLERRAAGVFGRRDVQGEGRRRQLRPPDRRVR